MSLVMVICLESTDFPHSSLQTAVYTPIPTWIVIPVLPLFHSITWPTAQLPLSVASSVPQRKVLSVPTIGASGTGLLVIVTGADAGDSPHLSLQMAVYVPTPTWIVIPIMPLFHWIVSPTAQAAVKVASSLPQTMVLFTVTIGALGNTISGTTTALVSLTHPFPSLT